MGGDACLALKVDDIGPIVFLKPSLSVAVLGEH